MKKINYSVQAVAFQSMTKVLDIYTTFYITLLRKKCEIISGITQHWLNNFYEFILISVPCEKKSLNFTMYRE